jgi:hypothetical protein
MLPARVIGQSKHPGNVDGLKGNGCTSRDFGGLTCSQITWNLCCICWGLTICEIHLHQSMR